MNMSWDLYSFTGGIAVPALVQRALKTSVKYLSLKDKLWLIKFKVVLGKYLDVNVSEKCWHESHTLDLQIVTECVLASPLSIWVFWNQVDLNQISLVSTPYTYFHNIFLLFMLCFPKPRVLIFHGPLQIYMYHKVWHIIWSQSESGLQLGLKLFL